MILFRSQTLFLQLQGIVVKPQAWGQVSLVQLHAVNAIAVSWRVTTKDFACDKTFFYEIAYTVFSKMDI